MTKSCHLFNRKDQCATVVIGSHCNRLPNKNHEKIRWLSRTWNELPQLSVINRRYK